MFYEKVLAIITASYSDTLILSEDVAYETQFKKFRSP